MGQGREDKGKRVKDKTIRGSPLPGKERNAETGKVGSCRGGILRHREGKGKTRQGIEISKSSQEGKGNWLEGRRVN